MPKKKVEPKIPPNYAKTIARQRRLNLLSKADGLLLLDLLKKAGIRFHKRGNAACSIVSTELDSFVIDLNEHTDSNPVS